MHEKMLNVHKNDKKIPKLQKKKHLSITYCCNLLTCTKTNVMFGIIKYV